MTWRPPLIRAHGSLSRVDYGGQAASASRRNHDHSDRYAWPSGTASTLPDASRTLLVQSSPASPRQYLAEPRRSGARKFAALDQNVVSPPSARFRLSPATFRLRE